MNAANFDLFPVFFTPLTPPPPGCCGRAIFVTPQRVTSGRSNTVIYSIYILQLLCKAISKSHLQDSVQTQIRHRVKNLPVFAEKNGSSSDDVKVAGIMTGQVSIV